jgi:hypothetical protein
MDTNPGQPKADQNPTSNVPQSAEVVLHYVRQEMNSCASPHPSPAARWALKLGVASTALPLLFTLANVLIDPLNPGLGRLILAPMCCGVLATPLMTICGLICASFAVCERPRSRMAVWGMGLSLFSVIVIALFIVLVVPALPP